MIRKHLEEIPPVRIERQGFFNMTARFALTKDDAVPNYALRVMEFGPRGHTSLHAHREEHEFYFLDGNAELVAGDGSATPMCEGDCVYIAPNEPHQLRNTSNKTMRVVCTIPILAGGDGKQTTQDTRCGH
jgi:quercetin dioxygenase-like cupin family protein